MSEQHVTLDWGTSKVHLASGKRTPFGNELSLCGEARAGSVREGTIDTETNDTLCARCLKRLCSIEREHPQ